MKKAILTPVFLCLGIAAGTWSATASASDDKSYPAYACQATDGLESNFNRSEYRLTRVGAGGSGTVLCPVIKDVYECDNFWGGPCSSAQVEVEVYDQHHDGNITCAFTARNETGSQVAYDSDTSVQGHDTLKMNLNKWPTGRGAYALRCTMPPTTAATTPRCTATTWKRPCSRASWCGSVSFGLAPAPGHVGRLAPRGLARTPPTP